MNCAANPQLVALEPFTIGTRPLDHGRKKLIEAGSSRELELGWHGYDTAIANQAAPLAPSWTCTVWVNLSHVDLAPYKHTSLFGSRARVAGKRPLALTVCHKTLKPRFDFGTHCVEGMSLCGLDTIKEWHHLGFTLETFLWVHEASSRIDRHRLIVAGMRGARYPTWLSQSDRVPALPARPAVSASKTVACSKKGLHVTNYPRNLQRMLISLVSCQAIHTDGVVTKRVTKSRLLTWPKDTSTSTTTRTSLRYILEMPESEGTGAGAEEEEEDDLDVCPLYVNSDRAWSLGIRSEGRIPLGLLEGLVDDEGVEGEASVEAEVRQGLHRQALREAAGRAQRDLQPLLASDVPLYIGAFDADCADRVLMSDFCIVPFSRSDDEIASMARGRSTTMARGWEGGWFDMDSEQGCKVLPPSRMIPSKGVVSQGYGVRSDEASGQGVADTGTVGSARGIGWDDFDDGDEDDMKVGGGNVLDHCVLEPWDASPGSVPLCMAGGADVLECTSVGQILRGGGVLYVGQEREEYTKDTPSAGTAMISVDVSSARYVRCFVYRVRPTVWIPAIAPAMMGPYQQTGTSMMSSWVYTVMPRVDCPVPSTEPRGRHCLLNYLGSRMQPRSASGMHATTPVAGDFDDAAREVHAVLQGKSAAWVPLAVERWLYDRIIPGHCTTATLPIPELAAPSPSSLAGLYKESVALFPISSVSSVAHEFGRSTTGPSMQQKLALRGSLMYLFSASTDLFVAASSGYQRCPRALVSMAVYPGVLHPCSKWLLQPPFRDDPYAMLRLAPLMPPLRAMVDVSLTSGDTTVRMKSLSRDDMSILKAFLSVRTHPEAQGAASASRRRRHHLRAKAEKAEAEACISQIGFRNGRSWHCETPVSIAVESAGADTPTYGGILNTAIESYRRSSSSPGEPSTSEQETERSEFPGPKGLIDHHPVYIRSSPLPPGSLTSLLVEEAAAVDASVSRLEAWLGFNGDRDTSDYDHGGDVRASGDSIITRGSGYGANRAYPRLVNVIAALRSSRLEESIHMKRLVRQASLLDEADRLRRDASSIGTDEDEAVTEEWRARCRGRGEKRAAGLGIAVDQSQSRDGGSAGTGVGIQGASLLQQRPVSVSVPIAVPAHAWYHVLPFLFPSVRIYART